MRSTAYHRNPPQRHAPPASSAASYQTGSVEIIRPFVVSARVTNNNVPEPVLLSRDLRHSVSSACSIAGDSNTVAFHPRPAW